jgi:hypothetical protein
MKSDKNEYSADLQIDKYKLSEEWEDQSLLYMKWAERYAQAIYERDRLKEKMDLVKAQIDLYIRKNPNQYGFDTKPKPTEAAITNTILNEEEYQEAVEDYLLAKKNVNILQGVKDAMEHKKKALEAETSLWIGNYYSDPKVPEKAKEDSSRKTSEELRKGLPRRRRTK